MESGAVTIFQPIGDRKIAAARSKIEQQSFPTALYVQGHAGISVNVIDRA